MIEDGFSRLHIFKARGRRGGIRTGQTIDLLYDEEQPFRRKSDEPERDVRAELLALADDHVWRTLKEWKAKLEDGKARNVQVVLGHVAPTPHVAKEAAQSLEGKEVTEDSAAEAGKAAATGAKPLAQNGYKVKLVEVAVKRALLTAADKKKYWET